MRNGPARADLTTQRWRRLRRIVLDQAGGECAVERCPRVADTVDHIVPHAHGGTDDLDNLQALCRHHNSSKGARGGPPWSRSLTPDAAPRSLSPRRAGSGQVRRVTHRTVP